MKSLACSRMWSEIHIRIPFKELGPCCRSKKPIYTVDDIKKYGKDIFNLNHNIINDRKQTIYENKLPQSCKVCIDNWPNSFWQSRNEWQNNNWSKKRLDKLIYEDHVRFIEIMLSNLCNMTCSYCNERFSSKWSDILDTENLYKTDEEWKNEILKSLYEYLKSTNKNNLTFNFLGGEPLLHPEIFSIIENIVNIQKKTSGNIIRFSTNLNVKPRIIDNLIKISNEYKNFQFVIGPSIDAIGTQGEYIRDGLNWKLFETNVKKILGNSNMQITFCPAMNSLNIPFYKDLLLWIQDLFEYYNYIPKYTPTNDNIVFDPIAYHPGILTDEYKEHIRESRLIYRNFGSKFHFREKFFDTLENNIGTKRSKENLELAKQRFEWENKIKNKNYFELFPHLTKILN